MKINDAFRFNGSHKACGAKFSVLARYQWNAGRNGRGPDFWRTIDGTEFEVSPVSQSFLLYRCACGILLNARPVLGKFNPGKVCNAKCQASIGHQCECACGGKNHGASHGA